PGGTAENPDRHRALPPALALSPRARKCVRTCSVECVWPGSLPYAARLQTREQKTCSDDTSWRRRLSIFVADRKLQRWPNPKALWQSRLMSILLVTFTQGGT